MSVSSRPTTHARHKRHTPKRGRQGAAIAVTGLVSVGMAMGVATPAGAAEKPVSQARGFFLSGSALGVNLDDIVELEDAEAKNYGGATVRELNPLSATLLNSLDIPLGPINLLGGNGLIQLGAVNQAAIARNTGSAVGASGAVTDSGAIAVDGADDVPPANATVDLGGALGGALGDLVDVDLEVGALSANAKQARGKNGTQVGDYQIADLRLELEVPLLAGVLGPLVTQLEGVQGQVGAVGALLAALPLVTGVTGLDGLADLAGGVNTDLGTGGPVQVDLESGRITVDVEALLITLGLDLNNLPPNTEIIGMILEAVNARVLSLVTGELTGLVDTITSGVGGVGVVGGLPGVEDVLLAGLLDTLLGVAALDDLTTDFAAGSGLLDPVLGVNGALSDLVSLVVNAQSRSNGMFTQRALVIQVLPGAEPLARVNLASASVGPGAGPADDDDDDDDGDDDDNDGPSYELPHTGTAGTLGLGAAGLALIMAGAGAAASSTRSRGRHARN